MKPRSPLTSARSTRSIGRNVPQRQSGTWAAVAGLSAWLLVGGASAATVARQCDSDLEALPGFLLENDTGAKAELAQWGQAHFDAALAKAREDAAGAQDAEACTAVLNGYLKAWRTGHLWVATQAANATPASPPKQPPPEQSPTLRSLSAHTLLLTLPSFAGQYREPLVALLERNRKLLIGRANWIIDVRDNDGGDDSTYDALLAWLMPDQREDVGAEWLSTPANIEGHQEFCRIREPGDQQCQEFHAEAVERMRSVPPGTYVAQEPGPDVQYLRVDTLERRRPRRVAVLIDRRCGSSCEEFLLTVRQSFNVKLLGRRSRGSLDYSNLCPHTLPSGERVLWYATSRSKRLPDLPVDVAGIAPDIYLPRPADETARADEITRVRRWLEGGSLAPANEPSR